MPNTDAAIPERGWRRSQDFWGGAFLTALGLFAIYASSDLPLGTMRAIGAGMLPRALAVLVLLCGLGLIVMAFATSGARTEAWSWRGMVFVLGAVAAFGLTIRPFGLAVASPLAIVLSSFASDDMRWKETLIFAVVLTAVCIVLFSVALRLPIPVWPKL